MLTNRVKDDLRDVLRPSKSGPMKPLLGPVGPTCLPLFSYINQFAGVEINTQVLIFIIHSISFFFFSPLNLSLTLIQVLISP